MADATPNNRPDALERMIFRCVPPPPLGHPYAINPWPQEVSVGNEYLKKAEAAHLLRRDGDAFFHIDVANGWADYEIARTAFDTHFCVLAASAFTPMPDDKNDTKKTGGDVVE